MEIEKKTKALFRQIMKAVKPPPNLTLSEWADKYRMISVGASASSGHWHTSAVPYQKEIMDTITDIRIQKAVIMCGAQVGKTEMGVLNPIGYYIHYDPSPIMVIQPTIKLAEGFSKERLSPMIRDTPVLTGKVNDKSRNSGNTIQQKVFPGGSVAIVGANSPVGLRSRPVRILLADEIDAYPATAGKEGDPLLLAEKRMTTFWNRKEVDISTPTIKGISRIEAEYEHSSKGEWNVPCPCCGAMQPLKWKGIVYDKNKLDDIDYVCESCGVVSSEIEWRERFRDGKFIHADPENPVRGFHFNALASTLSTWREVVDKFIRANDEKKKGNIELLKAWTNLELGETWEEEGDQIEDKALMKRRERYNCEVPPEVIYLTAGVDTQDDRFEIEVVGWGPEYENWGIQYTRIYGDTSDPENQVWKDLDTFLTQVWTKPDGTKMRLVTTCVDSGGHRTNQVYKFCKARYNLKIFAIKGSNNPQDPYIKKPTQNNREKAYLFTLGVDTGKSLILQRLKVEEEGPGYCHFPRDEGRGYDEEYFKGLTSEKQILVYKKGRPLYEWKVKDNEHKRNEPLDCRNYASAAIEISGLPLKAPEKKQGKQTGTAQRRRRGRRTNGGIL